MALDLNNKSILVTGGTGSFGKKFVEMVYAHFPDVKRLVIYSRDELKQFEMSQSFPHSKYKSIRYFIGDVRDGERFKRACEGIDIIIHAAAMKQVPAAEYNPMECIKTNVLGAENIINAALDCGVKDVVALSTDKAAAPINLYGATKLCSDKLFVAANNMKGKRDIKFSVVRYGNVIGSRGSVVPFFLKKREEGVLPITHQDMTRFNISLEEGVEMVFHALETHWGGEIFVPKIPSYVITELAKAIGPNCKQEIVGIRPGEKLHEEMITETDSLNTVELDNYYVILPSTPTWTTEDFLKAFNGKMVPLGFKYNSGTNDEWLDAEQLRDQIRQHVDASFTI
ncbi:UDP-N-acetylglucosamine 4,6-dehydratase (inverting) [Pontibacter sp. BT310]|uniref:UDP-N-acetylglucosamine 4,6-dehydratase (Inverting) n=1 Tax=Pontibacter populi TaxID=890055 RepID=A0ABS6XEY4_9BACT|nr:MULTISPECIES: UDP-N-acetylglucosamine 4,6-dehydratase (inverting) [Pontibacter]MBJ6119684.1 UDP-N-acetylglucosamine 4,6-dehydratase (inverting) [Pontibacter sp. BT310]MBR0572113.1 UDP-N-acetylglucosamine 4,6-dehydratase (inverting) [Microvirga sp. STS03]MBW3366537.1 UDP-N-acetylglucosamine 4,6-dehydratase (inverting) [Pontibacter populi]